jgi:GTP pyrophosphokinase
MGVADRDGERVRGIRLQLHLDREQLFDHVSDLRLLGTARTHHRELDRARRVFVHAQRHRNRRESRTARLAELERAIRVLRQKHSLDRDLLGTVRRDQLDDFRVDDAQAIREWSARRGDAALGDDAQGAVIAVDDAETGAQTPRIETQDARGTGRQKTGDGRRGRGGIGPEPTPGRPHRVTRHQSCKPLPDLEKTARIIAAGSLPVHNLHACSDELRSAIDRDAARLEGWGVARVALSLATESAVIVASLTEDAVLATAILAQAALGAIDKSQPNFKDTEREVELHFGPGVIALARELAHFGDIRLTPLAASTHHLEPAQAEALRKMLLSVVSDPRLVLARLARQLVDLNAAKDAHAATRERLALETREVFAPLANRLGLWQLKWELEDLAFRFLKPDDYRRIAAALAEKRADRERYITEFCRALEQMARAAGIDAEIYGRPKHIYSIHRKMERKQLSFEQVFDLRAVRIVTASVPDCYAMLGLVHGRFTYIRGEFDDYIATPKDNFYRSIHTAVLGPEGKAVEVQIRTREMHDQAELGLAAHWKYKEGRHKDSRAYDVSYDRKIEWVRKLLESDTTEGDRDFLDEVRAELFEDRVYALTPKGEVVDLPPGATPLDFAYHVHTDLGHRTRGARVNGRIVPLTRALANGEIVEIITHKHPAPSRDWLSETQGFLVSPRSRSKVRAWFRKLDEDADKAPPPVEAAAPVSPAPPRRRTVRRNARSPVVLGGVEDLPTSFARCCAPVKPEPIAGYATVGRGVTIHRAECPGLKRMSATHPGRLIAASWADAEQTQPVTLTIVAIDRQGLVRDVGDLLAGEKISIEMMHTTTDRTQSTATIDLRIAINDAQHLARLLQRLRKVGSVLSVRRSG